MPSDDVDLWVAGERVLQVGWEILVTEVKSHASEEDEAQGQVTPYVRRGNAS